MKARKAKHGWLLTLIFSVISVLYMLSLIHISEPTRPGNTSRMPSSA